VKIEERSFQDIVSNQDIVSKSISATPQTRSKLWAGILRYAKVKTMVEVGVWKGDFAKNILEQCEFIDRYYMIDPWANLPDWNKPANAVQEVFENIYEEAMSKTAFASSKTVILRGRTKEVIDSIPENSLDFAYIDGDHTLRGITIDLIKLLPKIKESGLIGGDDFIKNPWYHGIHFEPTLICPFSIYFAEAMDLPILALPFNQFLIQKRVDASFSFIDITGNYSNISLKEFHPWSGKYDIKKKVKLALANIGLIK